MTKSIRWRPWFWALGLVVVVGSAALAPWPDGLRTAGPLGVALGWGVLGLVIELAATARRGAGRAWGEAARLGFRPRDPSLADGVVGLIPLRDVHAEPDPATAPYRRFIALVPRPGEAHRPPPRPADHFPPLKGRVVVLSLFIGRDGRDWSPTEIGQAHKGLARAGEWIEREARRWTVPVNVDLADCYFVARDDRPAADSPLPIEELEEYGRFVENERVDALARFSAAARVLGFADAVEMTQTVAARIEADHRVWLLHHRSAGQSIAIPGDLTDLPGVTLAVCYAREEDHEQPLSGPPFPDPVTFIHELLHLFGALDKYDEPLGGFPRGSVSDRDIMRLDTESLSRLRVDPLTAAELVWASPGAVLPPDPPRARRAGGR